MAIFLCEWRSRMEGPARGRLVLEVALPTGRHRATVKRVVRVDEHATGRFTLQFRSRGSGRGGFAFTTGEASCHRMSD